VTSQSTRLWLATVTVVIVVIAVWKFIDYRTQPPPPPPPPHKVAAPAKAP
jgi:ABC-type nitrate/sulfonate/bicarbonate transport system permease component